MSQSIEPQNMVKALIILNFSLLIYPQKPINFLKIKFKWKILQLQILTVDIYK